MRQTTSRITTLGTAILAAGVMGFAPDAAWAADATLDGGNTAWILTATALVLFMTLPGLALFYGGLVQSKNVLSVFMHCFTIACLASVLWLFGVYSLAFDDGGATNAMIGGLGKAFLSGVSLETLSGDIPESLFFMFQMTFAIITPALIVGAYPERMRFSAVLWFSALWLIFVYILSTELIEFKHITVIFYGKHRPEKAFKHWFFTMI